MLILSVKKTERKELRNLSYKGTLYKEEYAKTNKFDIWTHTRTRHPYSKTEQHILNHENPMIT